MGLEKHFKESGKRVESKVWGTEFTVVNKEYCGKIFEILPMSQSSLHYHAEKSETFMCIDGLVQVEVDGETHILRGWAKDSVDIPAGVKHRFSNFEPTVAWVIEFSTHHNDYDTYRVEESRRFA